jgi:hypothetical protein
MAHDFKGVQVIEDLKAQLVFKRYNVFLATQISRKGLFQSLVDCYALDQVMREVKKFAIPITITHLHPDIEGID